MADPTPIFTRTFDFLTWLLPVTNHFPTAHRHTFTRRLLDAAFDLREQLEAANHRRGAQRLACLNAADEALDKVRTYLRLAAGWQWLSAGQSRAETGTIPVCLWHGLRNRQPAGRLAQNYATVVGARLVVE